MLLEAKCPCSVFNAKCHYNLYFFNNNNNNLHDLYTEEVNKVALSSEDDKRVIMEDGIHTLAYGHYSLKN